MNTSLQRSMNLELLGTRPSESVCENEKNNNNYRHQNKQPSKDQSKLDQKTKPTRTQSKLDQKTKPTRTQSKLAQKSKPN